MLRHSRQHACVLPAPASEAPAPTSKASSSSAPASEAPAPASKATSETRTRGPGGCCGCGGASEQARGEAHGWRGERDTRAPAGSLCVAQEGGWGRVLISFCLQVLIGL